MIDQTQYIKATFSLGQMEKSACKKKRGVIHAASESSEKEDDLRKAEKRKETSPPKVAQTLPSDCYTPYDQYFP
ncbi:MAG TPA: hypothetical protein ENJ82_04245 [Bacteroidetes bacterium]|nr:hypothetical protein [Bacteroidota bacterium]